MRGDSRNNKRTRRRKRRYRFDVSLCGARQSAAAGASDSTGINPERAVTTTRGRVPALAASGCREGLSVDPQSFTAIAGNDGCQDCGGHVL